MKGQCSPIPYRTSIDDNLVASGLYHEVLNNRDKINTDLIDILINENVLPNVKQYADIRGIEYEVGNIKLEQALKNRILTAFLYSEADARTPHGVTGYPVYNSGELKLDSVIASLATDETYNSNTRETFKSLAKALNLNIETAFNPTIVNTSEFNEMDYADISRILTAAYFKVKKLSKEDRQKRFGTNYDDVSRSGFKSIIITELKKEFNEAISSSIITRTKFQDSFANNVFNNLNKSNSEIFNYFLDYINKNYGINRKTVYKNNKILIDESTEEGQRDSIEDVDAMWDELQKERIDRKNTLASSVKSQIALLIGDKSFNRRTFNKMYISIPVDINVIWNQLIEAHLYDVIPEDYYNRLKQLSSVNSEFDPIVEIFSRVFENNGFDATDTDKSFVNAYISGIGLAVIPVNIMALETGNNVSIYQNNRESFGVKTYIDRFESVIDSNIEFGLYSDINSKLKFNQKSNSLFDSVSKTTNINTEKLLNKQMEVINYLGLDVSRDALIQYYNDNKNSNELYSNVNDILNNISLDIIKRTGTYNGKIIPANNVNGYMQQLAKIATYDFNSFTNMSYLDVQGKLNYSPQFDSMLTKFLRGFVTRTGVNKEYIKNVFKDYLNDPTLIAPGAEDNILIYDEKTGLGIFTKGFNGEWDIHPSFIKDVEKKKQFALSAFNGVKLGNKGLKYKDVQGALYTYTEIILNMLNQYVFLTSDSPRSYMMSTKRIDISNLFIKNENAPKIKISVKKYGSNYDRSSIENITNSIFIFSGDSNSRFVGNPDKYGQGVIRGLSNTIEIDAIKGFEVINGKNTNIKYFSDEDYDEYIKDFEKRVVPFINKSLKEGKNIYLPMSGIGNSLSNKAPKIYTYVNNYLNSLQELNKYNRITSNEINTESSIFYAIEKIVNSDINKFNTFGKIIFELRDNSLENIEKMKTRHDKKYWNKGKIYDSEGIPVGKAFKFLNITYIEDNRNITLPDHIAKLNNISVAEVYRNMIAQLRNEDFNINYTATDSNIKSFVTSYIRWNATAIVDSTKPIIKSLYDSNIKKDNEVSTIFDTYIADLVNEVYLQKANDWIRKANNRLEENKKSYTLDNISQLRKESLHKEAYEHILNNYDIIDNDGVRLSILEVLLNHTIYNHSMNAIFNGDIEEYNNTVDLNKRVAQVIKNGLNSINSINDNSLRKILVVEDMNFNSNILDKMNIENETIIDAYRKTATINDSQSLMTDVSLIKLLKATGRWNETEPIYKYITDLQDKNKAFDPTAYSKIVEQVKLFGTARRRRGDFYKASGTENDQYDIFSDEIDSIQVKDSTIVLFESFTRGSALGDLYDWMIKNQVDQISPISAVKVSGITPVKIHNDNAGLDIESLNNIDNQSMLYMQDNDFVIQQDIKADLLDETTVLGSQLVKQIMEGLDWDNNIYELNGSKVTGQELFKEFQTTLSTNIREDAMQLLYEIGGIDNSGDIRTDAKGNIQININKLTKKFQEIIADDVDAITIRKALEIGSDGLPIMPLSYPVIRGKLEKILASMLSKQVINKYLPGFHAPIRADIFTANNDLIKHNEIYKDKELYNKIIDDLANNGSITYSSDFINRCKNENRSLELRAEYHENDKYHYAEVIINPWKIDFFKNIGIVKTITNSDGSTKDIISVDIDKIDVEARRMIGIRIPTEGKQSMVVFEIVGFLNSNATQAIFPQSLVTRTGWDFDIDSIYAYYRNVKFEQGKYSPIQFDSKFDASLGQAEGKFAKSIYKQKYLELATFPQDFINLASDDFINICKIIRANFNPNIIPTESNQSIISNISTLINEDLLDIKSNDDYIKTLKYIQHNLKNGFAKNYGNVVTTVIEYLKNENINDKYKSDLLINAKKGINDLIIFVKTVKSQLDNIDIDPNTISNFDTIKSKFNTLNDGIDNYIQTKLLDIEKNIDRSFSEFTKNYPKDKTIYELNSREARDNHLLDIITSILSNPIHTEEVNKPNSMVELQETSNHVNALWNYTLTNLNPNNLMDKITLNNMSMGSTTLKGHSVNMDTLFAVISTVNGKLKQGIKRVIDIEDLVLPKGFSDRNEMYITNDKGTTKLTTKYRKFLTDRYGSDNFQLLTKQHKLWVNDVWINNDSLNNHFDISGERVELQMNQFTSGILDVLKAGLGFNLNTYTLGIGRTISAGVTIESFNGKANRFSYQDAFIHQPAIVEAIEKLEIESLNNPIYKLEDAINNIKLTYEIELAKLYSNSINNNSIKSIIKNYDAVMSMANGRNNRLLNVNILNELAEVLPNITISEISGKFAYQTTKELFNNIKNRNNRTADWLLRQINVLDKFIEYSEIATNLINLNFMLKSESRVDSFFKADQKERKLAEYYYPVSALKNLVNNKYNETLKFINDYLEDTNTKQSKDKIKIDFERLSSYQFRNIYKPKDSEGKVLASITYADLKLFKETLPKANTIDTRKELIETLNIGYEIPNTVILPNGKDIIESIFPGSFEGYLTGSKFNNTENDSSYSLIQSRYQYAHWLMANGFGDIFITRNSNITNSILGQILAKRNNIDESTYKYVVDGITNYLISTTGAIKNPLYNTKPILTAYNTNEVLTILGIASDELKNKQKEIFKNLIGTIKNGISINNFTDYSKLSLAQQINFIKKDPTLSDYINKSPEFKNDNIFKYLDIRKNVNNKAYDIIRIQKDDNDINSWSNITDSILKMWDSNIPYIAHTIRQLLVYTYVTEGFNYAYNISKYIPIELISSYRPNNAYDTLTNIITYVDPSANLGSYADNLKNAEKAVFDDSVDIEPIINIISRMKSDINIRLLSNKQKAYRWLSDKSKATIGYVLQDDNNPNSNVAIGTYEDENGNNHEFYLETEARLINSEYATSEYVSSRGNFGKNKLYKRYLIPTNSNSAFNKVYIFLPINPLLKNEISLMQNDMSIVPEYQTGMMAKDGDALIDRVEYISTLPIINDFLNVISKHSNIIASDISDNNELDNNVIDDETSNIEESDSTDELDTDIEMLNESNTNELYSLDLNIAGLTDIENIYSSASDIIEKELINSDNSIYISSSENNNFYKGYHKNAIQVDYTKSPKDEALRIAKFIKSGSLYINGDNLSDTNKSQQYLTEWTTVFINNIYKIVPAMTSISTILNDGVGQAVAKTYVDVPRRNINIYGDLQKLHTKIIKVENTSKDNLRNAYITNADIGVEVLNTMNRIQRFLTNNNIGNREEFINIIKSFDEENFEGGIIAALKDREIEAIKASYARITNLSNVVYDSIKQLLAITKAVDYSNIRDNYGAILDYKDRLNTILKLSSHFTQYLGLQEIKIEDTIYKDATPEDNDLFVKEFGELNNHIVRLKSLASKVANIEGNVINYVKDVITFQVIDESRNPKFVTAFSKIKDYLKDHNWSLEGFDINNIEITEDEWLNIQRLIFTLDKDITKIQAFLDSSFVTGNTLVDITGKSWDKANYKSKKSIQKVNDDLESALEEFQEGLSKNPRAREKLMHKFINEYGDLIGSYKTDGLGDSTSTLKNDLKDAIFKNLYTDTGFVTRVTTEKTLSIIDNIIDNYNTKHSWNIVPVDINEASKHIYELSELSVREKYIYLQTNNLVELNLITDIGGKKESVLYKLDFSNTPKSKEYENLTDAERKLLDNIRSIIQKTIKEYDGNWINYYGRWDEVMPYIPQATLAQTLKNYASVPMMHKDQTFIDIDGTERYIGKATTLQIPRHLPAFSIRKKYNSESYDEYENNIVNIFNDWFKKNNKLKNAIPGNSIKDIRHYNDAIMLENKKYKAQTMSYDIMDIVKGFSQELYNLKAINNFEVDYQLTDYLMRYKDGNKPSAKETLKNVASQFDAMEKRIFNVSKYGSMMDVASGTLLRYTSMTFMYLNYTAGITNVLKGVTDMIIESTANNFVESGDIFKSGLTDVIKTIPKFLRDINQTRTDDLMVALIKDFDDIYQDTRDVMSSDTGTSYWVKALKMADTIGYAPNNMGEFIMQFGMLLAATQSHRVIGGKIMAFVDFYNNNLESLLKDTLTAEQYDKYLLFKEDLNAEITKEERKTKREYLWNHDYASQFIKENFAIFNKDQKKVIIDSKKLDKKVQREVFEKFNTLRSELKLEDGRLSFNKESGLTEETLSEFRGRVKAINQSLHGVYNRVDRNSLQDAAFGDLLMQFRKWMRPNFVRYFGRRFGRIFYNEQLGAYEVPVFNSVYDMFRTGRNGFKEMITEDASVTDYMKGLGNFFKAILSWLSNIGFYYNTLPLNEQIAALKFVRFMGALAFSAIAVIGLGSLKDDDEENSVAFQHAMYAAVTYYQQMIEPMPIYGWASTIEQTANSLFAGQKTITAAGKLINLYTQSIFVDDDEFIYDRGIYKGQDKRDVALRQMLPIMRQVNKFNNLGATMSYYNMYNPFGMVFDGFRNIIGRKDSDNNESDN